MIGAAAALALFGGIFSFDGALGRHRDLQIEHYRVTRWGLEVRRNHFTGQTACTLRRPGITYAHGVITFSFGHKINTANANFRVDNGSVRTVSSVAIEAASLGAQFNGPDLANPSRGEVHIPAAYVQNSTTVSIQPNDTITHRSFDLRGFSHALGEAKKQGCDAI